jgi:hypothetical protein
VRIVMVASVCLPVCIVCESHPEFLTDDVPVWLKISSIHLNPRKNAPLSAGLRTLDWNSMPLGLWMYWRLINFVCLSMYIFSSLECIKKVTEY